MDNILTHQFHVNEQQLSNNNNGGGLYVGAPSETPVVEVYSSTFEDCVAQGWGGAIDVWTGSLLLSGEKVPPALKPDWLHTWAHSPLL